MIRRTLTNGRELYIMGIDRAVQMVKSGELMPFAVLLSAWSDNWNFQPGLAEFLDLVVRAGCRYVVCVGDFAKQLHDAVDDVLIDRRQLGHVLTTWHDDEPIDETAVFFAIDIITEGRNQLLALLDPSEDRDKAMEKALLELE